MQHVAQTASIRDGAPTPKESQLRRGLRSLDIVARGAATASEVARKLGVNRSTALRILQELEAAGYVVRTAGGMRYAIASERLFELAAADDAAADISEVIHPMLVELRDAHGEATMFAVPARGRMVYLVFLSSPHPVSVRERIGTVRPLHASALGKAWLSGLPATAREEQIGGLDFDGGSPLAARTPEQLRSRLTEVLDHGFAVDRDETFEGVSCVAVPVFVGDVLVGAAGVTGPTQRFSPQRIAQVGEDLRRRVSAMGEELA
jgi:DNA-binding IclR family transcriptional regulator